MTNPVSIAESLTMFESKPALYPKDRKHLGLLYIEGAPSFYPSTGLKYQLMSFKTFTFLLALYGRALGSRSESWSWTQVNEYSRGFY